MDWLGNIGSLEKRTEFNLRLRHHLSGHHRQDGKTLSVHGQMINISSVLDFILSAATTPNSAVVA